MQPQISSSSGSQTQIYMIDMIESEFCQHGRWFLVCVIAVEESKNIVMVILDAQFHSFDEASICNI